MVGKIESEHSYSMLEPDETKMKRHNLLFKNVTDYFMTVFRHYLGFNKIKEYDTHLNSIWVNEMKQHEYNHCTYS